MKGTRILVTARPQGQFEEAYISGTPKPGTCMEIDPGTAAKKNVFTYQAYGVEAASGGRGVTNDGDRKRIAVLLEKNHEGKIYSDAYASGDMGLLYHPRAGEQLNMLVQNQEGTGDSFAIGSEFMVDDGTGKLLACDSNAEAHPFTCLEVVAALTADGWAWCVFNGEGGA